MGNYKDRQFLKNVRRLVVKVGSSSLAHPSGKLNLLQIERLVRQLADLHNQGKEIILVTSGAVAAGLAKLGFEQKPRTIPEKQAAAAVGQGILMHLYEKLFGEYGQVVAQVLLTRDDIADRKRYLNARNAMLALLRLRVIPIINENDTVVVEEIRFGDNDTLSALVAGLVDADLLILLSDIDGVYTADPRTDPGARLIEQIDDISDEIEAAAGGCGTRFGSGGMATKIQAAKIAMESGIAMIITNSWKEAVLHQLLNGAKEGTLFLPSENKPHSRKKWIAFGSAIQGTLYVDSGARDALLVRGKSLLPSGITSVEGDFAVGSVVSVKDEDGREIARGIVNYSSAEIAKIKGKNTKDILACLGHKDYDEVIHRDNLSVKGGNFSKRRKEECFPS